MIQSMSRVGKCIDDGPIECFWGKVKTEAFYGLHFSDETELMKKIEYYIFFYNNIRLQKNLKGMAVIISLDIMPIQIILSFYYFYFVCLLDREKFNLG